MVNKTALAEAQARAMIIEDDVLFPQDVMGDWAG
jgi:GR25 family glycosyltransferase involved in LPS biosynthesis